ncbi:uncharacterized protein LOC125810964 [Solanum verrucosum]|uniref:uncharacterized protein LOC125810964 n=1 Tax=Solanum verrucosum TaxID=315347 RepID=UPI0020D00E28|nr:uncharacterized protein LOC125810964 [Solanum verrucosum]
MAENYSLHSFHVQTTNFSENEVEQEDPTYSFSPSNLTFFIPSFDDFDSGPESESVDSESDRSDLIANPSSFFYGNEDQVDLVTDLFDSRNDYVTDHPRVVHSNSNVRVLTDGEEVELEFEFDGLRVVGVDSESDSEDVEVISGVIHQIGDSRVPDLWSCFRVGDEGVLDEDSEWEEVERVEGRGDNLSYLIGRMEEISVSSDFSSEEGNLGLGEDGEEGQVRNLEWEFLVAVNDLERSLEFHNAVILQDDGGFGTFDFVGSQERLKGSPPAAKSVLENLPLLVVSDENLKGSNAACAVCKDEILSTEKVTRLPCSHYYHCDCIVPWLNIRNTCPVCRHELPTDDADYERENGRSAGPGHVNDFQLESWSNPFGAACQYPSLPAEISSL